jgi:hypothetical protein
MFVPTSIRMVGDRPTRGGGARRTRGAWRPPDGAAGGRRAGAVARVARGNLPIDTVAAYTLRSKCGAVPVVGRNAVLLRLVLCKQRSNARRTRAEPQCGPN